MNESTPLQTKADILIVDDTVYSRRLFSTLLAQAGYQVRTAQDGLTALEIVKKAPPDLILLDILMPEMDGIEVCQRLKNNDRTRDIPVIFISALGEMIDKVKGFEAGGVDYITKPFQVEEILARVETHLAVHQLQKQLESKNAQLQREIAKRRQAETTLLEERNLLRALVDNLPDLIYIKDIQSRFLLVNDATRRHLGGATIEEVIGKTDFDFSPTELAEQYYADEQKIFETGRALILHEEPSFDHETETTRWLLTIKVPFYDNQDHVTGLVGMNRDITKLKQTEDALRLAHDEVEMKVLQRTADLVKANEALQAEIYERKQVEQALRESEERYKQLLDSVTDYIYTVSVEGDRVVTTTHGPNCVAVTGYTATEYQANPDLWYQMVYWEDQPAVLERVNKLLAGQEAEPLDHRIYHKNGSVRWVRNTAVLRRDVQGNVISYEGLISDITARKEAEEALRRSERKYRMLMEQASDGITIIDETGHLVQVNSQMCEMLQYSREEILTRNVADLIPAPDLAVTPVGFDELRAGQTLLRERSLRRQDGTLLPVEISSKMIEPDRILAILRDISERKAVERRENLAHQLGRQLTTLLDPDALLVETVNRLKETFGYYYVHVYLLDGTQRFDEGYRHSLTVREGTGEAGIVLKGKKHAIDLDTDRSLVAQAALSLQPIVANDVSQYPDYLPNPFLPQTQSEAAFPLFLGQRLIGVLDVQHTGVDRFNDNEVRTLQIVASQLSVALANAELFAEQERLLEEVKAGRERLQALSHRLVEVQEAERRHIARELHDEVGQLLTGLKLTLDMSLRLPNEEIRYSLDEPQALVNDLIRRVRELSLELRPAMLDDLGLLPTLMWHFERYTAQTRIKVKLEQSGLQDRRFTAATETAAFRIIQEALTNVARYAGATEVTVRLWLDGNLLHVQIRDDGAGFDLEAIQATGNHSGLSGMSERAALLGGQLTIESARGVGTQLTAKLPLESPGG